MWTCHVILATAGPRGNSFRPRLFWRGFHKKSTDLPFSSLFHHCPGRRAEDPATAAAAATASGNRGRAPTQFFARLRRAFTVRSPGSRPAVRSGGSGGGRAARQRGPPPCGRTASASAMQRRRRWYDVLTLPSPSDRPSTLQR